MTIKDHKSKAEEYLPSWWSALVESDPDAWSAAAEFAGSIGRNHVAPLHVEMTDGGVAFSWYVPIRYGGNGVTIMGGYCARTDGNVQIVCMVWNHKRVWVAVDNSTGQSEQIEESSALAWLTK